MSNEVVRKVHVKKLELRSDDKKAQHLEVSIEVDDIDYTKLDPEKWMHLTFMVQDTPQHRDAFALGRPLEIVIKPGR